MLKLYNKSKIDKKNLIFDAKSMRLLLIPLIIEQVLNSLMGMADTMMVTKVGSSAVSAVSLVDTINILILQVFAALAAGGTIICSQYMGQKDEEGCNRVAEQVVITVFVISMAITFLSVIFRFPIIKLFFGKVEYDVMRNSIKYFLITSLSFPFIALFQAGAAFFRACGDSRFPMIVSVISNIINIIGNAILLFVFDMGVGGAAISTLISRIFCMAVVFWRLKKPKQSIVLKHYVIFKPKISIIRVVLEIGIPAGIENGMFQFGKLAIQSSVSTLGTTAIAAQAMTIMIEYITGIAALGMGIGLMTIVGQSIGAGRIEEAKYYIVKITAISEVIIIICSIVFYILTKPITIIAGMDPKSADMCIDMMFAITIVKPLVWTCAFIPAYGMRAAGDVKFSMITSSIIMWLCRVVPCIYLIRFLGFGPMAVWIGMFFDWTVRFLVFIIRFLSGRWVKDVVTV